jgi:DNA-directed RNA polymerase subunit P
MHSLSNPSLNRVLLVFKMPYICHQCKREVTSEGLKTLPGVKCPYCGGRILYKTRPPVVKRVKGV